MKVIKINKAQREEWNRFVTENPYGSFLQSFEWSQFQESLGRQVFRLAIPHVAQTLVIKYKLPFGKSYLYSPHGPIIDTDIFLKNSVAAFKILSKKVREIAQKEKAIFWRMDPIMSESKEGKGIFKNLGLEKLSREIQPKKTLVLNLGKSKRELLGQMHHKTRYNIRLAKKRGVSIKTSNSIDIFWDLLSQTAKRDSFRTHPKEYYQKMLEIFSPAKLFLAKYKNKIIAADIVVFFGKRAAYLHGASDYKHRNLMAPYLLQWHQILEAKKEGKSLYDFWGIDEKKWPGVTRFKKGFGGKEIGYIGAWDLVYQPAWYKIYNLARRMKGFV